MSNKTGSNWANWLNVFIDTGTNKKDKIADSFRQKDKALEKALEKLLKDLDVTVGSAESCTGGYISHLITSSPKLSPYFMGSIISYSSQVKAGLLKVSAEAVKKDKAVNEKCAIEMLDGLLKNIKSDYGIAVTGFAGPGGGTAHNPVGTVWIAAGNNKDYYTQKLVFYNDRARNIYAFAIAALKLLRQFIEEKNNFKKGAK